MIFLIIIVILALAAEIFIAEKCLQMIVHPIRQDYARTRKVSVDEGFGDCLDAYDKKWDREDFSIDRNGVIIRGEIIRNPDAGNKVAIIAHGHTANRISAVKYADLFYRRGYHAVIYDERYFGESGGDFCTLGEREAEDLAAIIGYVRGIFKDCFIALHGEFMGAATVLLVQNLTKTDLVVADCPFSDSERLFNEYIVRNMSIPPVLVIPVMKLLALLQYNYHIRKTSPIQAVKQTDVPICFMHGIADTLIVCDHSKVMYEVCRNPLSELHLFEKAEHAMSIVTDRKKYEKILDEFIRKCGG